MDTARYYVALFIVAFAPGVLLFWFSVHPFIGFWRRVGPAATLAVHYGVGLALAAAVLVSRDRILAVEWGTAVPLAAVAVVLLVAAGALRFYQQRALQTRTLMGLPELAPQRYPAGLVTHGVYARLRHPRYVEIVLAFWGYALFSNYLAAYAVAGLSVMWAALLAPVEERELRARFGAAYVRYAAQVPRFIPRWRVGRGRPPQD